MKRLIYILTALLVASLSSCSLLESYGLWEDKSSDSGSDSELWEELDSLKNRVLILEAVMHAYESNLMITSIKKTNEGYDIVFTDGSKATILHGKDGKDGKDGEDGKDGADGETYIENIIVGDMSVTFILNDGTQFSIPFYNALSLTFAKGDLVVMEPNSTREIRYEVESQIPDVTVEVLSSSDIKAEVLPDGVKGGIIEVKTGPVIDRYSKVVVLASNGEKMVMKTLKFEEEAIEIIETTEKEIPSKGGEVELEFMSNTECEVKIPQEAQSWISVAPATKALTRQSIVLILQPNTEPVARSAEVTVYGDVTSLTFTITQDAATGDEGDEVEPEPEEPVFELSRDKAEVGYDGGTVEVSVTSNMDYDYSITADWVSELKTKLTETKTYVFEVAPNPDTKPRTAVVTFCGGTNCIPFTILQGAAPGNEDDGDDGSGDGGEDDGGDDGNEGEGQNGDWTTSEFYHRSVVMRFTADWCGCCPMMATALDDAQEQLPGKIEALSVHGGGSGLACGASETLAANYSISSFPTGLVDGLTFVYNYDIEVTTSYIIKAVEATESNYDVITGTSWTSSVSGSNISLDLSAYVKKAGSYKMTALLVEDDIIGYQAGASSDYEHNGVIRAAMSNALGDSFTVSEDNTVKEFEYTASVPSGCNKDNMRVVVYIQAKDGSAWYIDNSATAKLGTDKPLALISGIDGGGNEGIVPGDDIIL